MTCEPHRWWDSSAGARMPRCACRRSPAASTVGRVGTFVRLRCVMRSGQADLPTATWATGRRNARPLCIVLTQNGDSSGSARSPVAIFVGNCCGWMRSAPGYTYFMAAPAVMASAPFLSCILVCTPYGYDSHSMPHRANGAMKLHIDSTSTLCCLGETSHRSRMHI